MPIESAFIKTGNTESLTPQGLPIAVGGAPGTPIQFTKAFAYGNNGLIAFQLRVYGNLNLATASAGTVRTLGGLDAVIGLTVETDKHKKIVDNVDLRSVVRMYTQFLLRQQLNGSDVSAATTGTPTYNYEFLVPFCLDGGFGERGIVRSFDTILDLASGAKPLIKASIGDPSYFISGGTYSTETIQNLTVEDTQEYVENLREPVADSDPSELPFWMLTLEQIRFQTPASTGKQLLDLPYGDRRYVMIGLSERLATAPFDEKSDMTVDNTDALTLKIGSDIRIDNVMIKKIRDQNARRFGLSSMPTGWTVLDFWKSGRVVDTLDTMDDRPAGKVLRIEYNATGTIASRQIWANMLCLKPIPRAAVRPVQAQLDAQGKPRFLPYIPG